ncbi:hypothetical protein [Aeoliella sp. SH292]|uniref:hypothetical protein n=1 Tax=Aeoliella sp. SH292 TaxID=3454464 RepID=UPI003F945423
MTSKSRNYLLALGVATLIAIGCNSGPPTTLVSGTVTVDAKPVGPCAVSFYPSGSSRPLATMTQGEGRYQLSLPQGEYKIVVQTSAQLPAGWKEGDTIPAPPVPVPTAYSEPVTTPLTLSVTSSEALTHDLALSSKQR